MMKSNQINRTATVGAQPPLGQLKTGDLPLVQVKAAPVGRQVQEGQQRPLTILPPRDGKPDVTTGALPMVNVKMGQNGPQIDDGREQPVIIRDTKQAVRAGQLPMVNVKMDGGKPVVQNMPHVSGAGPQIPVAPPVLSAPRVTRAVAAPMNQGYTTTSPIGVARGVPSSGGYARPVRVGAPQAEVQRVLAPAVELPAVPELNVDQLMLCHHLATVYLTNLPTAETAEGAEVVEGATEGATEGTETEAAEQASLYAHAMLAKATIATIDDILVATVVRAEAAAKAAEAAAEAATAAPVVAPPMPVRAQASTSIAPAPRVSHNAGSASRSYAMPSNRPRNNAMAPRRTANSGGPLPMVEVKMDGQRPTVQNAAEVAAAKAAHLAARHGDVPSDLPTNEG